MLAMDWQGVLSGQPLQWIISGFLTTLWVTLAGIVLATLIAIFLLGLRLTGNRFNKAVVSVWVSVFRNTPLLVQLMFWYFAAWNWLPRNVITFINAEHPLVYSARRCLVVNTRVYLFSMGAGRIYLGIFGRGDRLWFTGGFCRTT